MAGVRLYGASESRVPTHLASWALRALTLTLTLIGRLVGIASLLDRGTAGLGGRLQRERGGEHKCHELGLGLGLLGTPGSLLETSAPEPPIRVRVRVRIRPGKWGSSELLAGND